MNKYRHMLADAIERNGGYSRYLGGRSALSWDVGLNVGVPDSRELLEDKGSEYNGMAPGFLMLQENWGVTFEQFFVEVDKTRLAHWRVEWDSDEHKQGQWDFVREIMAEGVTGEVHGTHLAFLRPEIATRYGIAYYRFPRRGESPFLVPDFHARFELRGRGGKHLCMTEFEGRRLEHSSDDLAQAIRDDDSGTYPNSWCQLLLAYVHECDIMFDSKAVIEEFKYQLTFRAADELYDLYEGAVRDGKEAAERLYWEERDVVTQ